MYGDGGGVGDSAKKEEENTQVNYGQDEDDLENDLNENEHKILMSGNEI